MYEYGVLLTKFYLVYISCPFFLQSLCPISETGGVAVRAPQSSRGEDLLWADPAVDWGLLRNSRGGGVEDKEMKEESLVLDGEHEEEEEEEEEGGEGLLQPSPECLQLY